MMKESRSSNFTCPPCSTAQKEITSNELKNKNSSINNNRKSRGTFLLYHSGGKKEVRYQKKLKIISLSS
jgi:hypothetical protein